MLLDGSRSSCLNITTPEKIRCTVATSMVDHRTISIGETSNIRIIIVTHPLLSILLSSTIYSYLLGLYAWQSRNVHILYQRYLVLIGMPWLGMLRARRTRHGTRDAYVIWRVWAELSPVLYLVHNHDIPSPTLSSSNISMASAAYFDKGVECFRRNDFDEALQMFNEVSGQVIKDLRVRGNTYS